MALSLIIFLCTRKATMAGEMPSTKVETAAPVAPELERKRVQAIFLIFGVVIFFWMAFNQNGVTLVLWAENHTETFLGINFKENAAVTLAINPALVILLTPLLVLVWTGFKSSGLEVSTPRKML